MLPYETEASNDPAMSVRGRGTTLCVADLLGYHDGVT